MIRFHPAAAREVHEARRYFDEISVELGNAFVEELGVVLARAERFPRSGRAWRKSSPERRVHLLRRFPFLVIVRVATEELRVLAVAHQRRKPGYWVGR